MNCEPRAASFELRAPGLRASIVELSGPRSRMSLATATQQAAEKRL